MLGAVNTTTQSHSNASIIRCLSVYGRCIIERSAVFRSHSYHVYASQISTGLYVFATSKNQIFGVKKILTKISIFVSFCHLSFSLSFSYTYRSQSGVFTYLHLSNSLAWWSCGSSNRSRKHQSYFH